MEIEELKVENQRLAEQIGRLMVFAKNDEEIISVLQGYCNDKDLEIERLRKQLEVVLATRI